MLKIKNYVKVQSIEEAYELNQKKTSIVLGGMVWLKMGNRNITTAIDLSGLGLDTVRETEESFVIGCMTSLRTLEMHPGLDAYTQGALRESLRHIVGVQFRNCATVGGSLWGRYGFSDVLTIFLALDAQVKLYRAGQISLREFSQLPKDNDILECVIVPKKRIRTVYLSQRNTETDFPVLTCAAAWSGDGAVTVIGARPGRAVVMEDQEKILRDFDRFSPEQREEAVCRYTSYVAGQAHFGSNMRASAEYRRVLAEVLTKRAWSKMNIVSEESSAESGKAPEAAGPEPELTDIKYAQENRRRDQDEA